MTLDRALRDRWAQDPDLARAVARALGTPKRLAALGLDVHEGHIDLRGYVRPPDGRDEHWNVDGATLEGIDLSGAYLPHFRLLKGQVTDCRFDGARLPDLRIWSTTFLDCSLRGADLREASLGAPHGRREVRYERVDFGSADLRGAHAAIPDFVDCDFSHARLDEVDFGSSTFLRCRFAGELWDVIFWGRKPGSSKRSDAPMREVDFTAADMRHVEFRGIDLSGVLLPADPDHLRIERPMDVWRLLADAPELASPRDTRILRGTAEHQLRWLTEEIGVGYIRRSELLDGFDDPAAGGTVLDDAIRRCRPAVAS